eukprot:TRINITY_DN456_c0_g1_i2.p1 TRINITY_DN456_c0_g1~~TRINITY_DN456_c0_g1_i2.p1  ORF type:complete len:1114 (+),score=210.50 TRINITY_DN456_c0_g1_i2:848-4189(+)
MYLFLWLLLSVNLVSGDPVDETKSQSDKRTYKYFVINENQLKVLVISDPETQISAAAIDVLVGSWSNPTEWPGLAHFCEHMLFLGTKKFPDEDGYGKYLAQHGGFSNAYTSSTNTNYYFEVDAPHLHGALDMFSQFFISPLFSANSTSHEINAVNSEHSKNINNDDWREYELMKRTANPDHPYSKFSTGSTETLETLPKEKGLDVRKALLEFHQQYYSSNLMTLVIVGKEPVDTLEQWANEFFAKVPNKNAVKPSWTTIPLPSNYLKKYITAVPVKDLNKLNIQFALPSVYEQFDTKPYQYVSHLLAHEVPGTVLHILKLNGWATGLSAGLDDNDRNWSTFDVNVALTPAGLDHLDDIISLIFQGIKLIDDSGVEEWRYEELRDMANLEYDFLEKQSASSYASKLAAYRGDYSEEYLLKADYLWKPWDETASTRIKQFLSHLTPQNIRVFVISPSFSGKTDQEEHYYGINYSVKNIDESKIKAWSDVNVSPQLVLPERNPFIPKDLTLKSIPDNVKATVPKQITAEGTLTDNNDNHNHHNHHHGLPISSWYLFDDIFQTPKGDLKVLIRSPHVYGSPLSALTSLLLTEMVTEEANKFAYFGALAGVDFTFSAAAEGFHVSISGYTDKQGVILQQFLEIISSIYHGSGSVEARQATFHLIKERVKRDLSNSVFSLTYKLAQTFLKESIFSTYWTFEHLLEVWPLVKLDDVRALAGTFWVDVSIDIFGHGNFLPHDLLEIQSKVENLLNFTKSGNDARSHSHQTIRGVELQSGNPVSYVVRNVTDDQNSAIIVYLQVGQSSIGDLAILDVLGKMLYQTSFNQLRTIEQLGYIVSASTIESYGVDGALVIVQSEKDSIYLDERIDNYLQVVFKQFLCSMSEETFQTYVDGTVSGLNEPPKSQSERTAKFWPEIITQRYEFLLNSKKAEALKTLNLEAVRGFSENFLINPHTRKRLSVQVQSSKHIVPSPDTVTEISDISEFKKNSPLYPSGQKLAEFTESNIIVSPEFCPNDNVRPSNDTNPSDDSPNSPSDPFDPKKPFGCISDFCFSNRQFYGGVIGGIAGVLFIVASFFGVRQYLNYKARRDAQIQMLKDEDEGFLSLDQPDADEFSDFSESP